MYAEGPPTEAAHRHRRQSIESASDKARHDAIEPDSRLLSLNCDILLQLARSFSLAHVRNMALTCHATRRVVSHESLWAQLVAAEVSEAGVAQLASLASKVGWRELHRRVTVGERCGWRSIQSARSPPPRAGHCSAVVAGKIVLYGGEGPGDSFLSDTWVGEEHQGTILWREAHQPTTPPPRVAMSTSVVGSAVYVFGGGASWGTFLGDTWRGSFDETGAFTWREVNQSSLRAPLTSRCVRRLEQSQRKTRLRVMATRHAWLEISLCSLVARHSQDSWRTPG